MTEETRRENGHIEEVPHAAAKGERGRRGRFLLVSLLAILLSVPGQAADWPMLGRDPSRNAVVPHAKAPLRWQVKDATDAAGKEIGEDRNIQWVAPLGGAAVTQPVISGNLVWVGTNNESLNGQKRPDASVLACFDVRTGNELFRYISPRRAKRIVDYEYAALGSAPLIESDLMWFTTNRTETVCLDIGPLRRGQGEPEVKWKVDMHEEMGVFPHAMTMFLNRTCSPASHKDWLYVVTTNGLDWSHTKVPAPEAPSLVCFNKHSGKVVWTDRTPGDRILHTQTSSPLVIEVGGEVQVVVGQGDGWLRAFAPEGDGEGGSKMLWEFDMNPKHTPGARFGEFKSPNSILATPVFHQGLIYLASGQEPEHGIGLGRLCCIDPSKRGDISSELAVDAEGKMLSRRRAPVVLPANGERAVPNPNSGLVWERSGYLDHAKGPSFYRSSSDVVIASGLLIAADQHGKVYCLDSKTGEQYWICDTKSQIVGSPLVVGDRIYLSNEDGEVVVFGLSADPEKAMARPDGRWKPLATNFHRAPIDASPSFANGTLYVATRDRLYALRDGANGEQAEGEARTRAGDDLAHWPQWRGPRRDNLSDESGLLAKWPEGGPPLRWRVDGFGDGIASVAIRDGRVITLGYREEREYVSAVSTETGEQLWMAEIGPAVPESKLMRWLGQRTPTIDKERVYAVRSDGDVVCLAVGDGRELWRKKCTESFGTKPGVWGFCDYPLVDGENLICRPGGSMATVVALDRKSGEVVWGMVVPERSHAHAATMVSEGGGIRQYVTFLHPKGLLSVAARDGRRLWLYDGLSTRIASSVTPLVRGDAILAFNGYGAKRGRLTLEQDRENSVKVREEYAHAKGFIDPFQDSTMWIGDRAYALRTTNRVDCYEAASGERLYEHLLPKGRCSMTYADGHLYVRSSEGFVSLINLAADELLDRAQFRLPDHQPARGASNPVIAGGRLWLRDDDRLFCYDLRKNAPPVPIPPKRIALLPGARPAADGHREARGPLRSVFVPTPHEVVQRMLEAAGVKAGDVVCDLGSGDGRIVIAAARDYGAKAVGYEIDRELVDLSRKAADEAGVAERVKIVKQDLFKADLKEFDVITVFLLPKQLKALRPKFDDLKPGTRIVSHQFELPEVKASRILQVEAKEGGGKHPVFLYTTPLEGSGNVE